MRADWLFWFLVICAAGFARYFFLARADEDLQLTVVAAIAFVLVVLVAVLELFGVVW